MNYERKFVLIQQFNLQMRLLGAELLVHLATDARHKRAGLSGLACRIRLPAAA